MKSDADKTKLLTWFAEHQRELPWRDQRTPYSIWVSEMMLQQTQASVVIPYFQRWMQRFPNTKTLSQASLDEVMKLWEGLGYYSRARYLHAGAKYIEEHCSGQFPYAMEALKKIKGLGTYTIGAILSLGFGIKIPAVDGNVIRVLTRYFGIEEDISQQKTLKTLNQLAYSILPDQQPGNFNEMLIELGATVCKKQPRCYHCPIQSSCKAYAQNKVEQIPVKSKKVQVEHLYRAVAIIQHEKWVIVRQVQEGEIMSGLYEFPYFAIPQEGISHEARKALIEKEFGFKSCFDKELSPVKHSFTRYRAHLFPALFVCHDKAMLPESYYWHDVSQLNELPFSSGHRRILAALNV